MRHLLFVGALVAAVAGAVAITAWVDDAGGQPEAVQIPLASNGASKVQGVAFFEQRGERLTGSVVVWGLEPGSEHAVHFHGPSSRCGTKADPVAAHNDLKANGEGVAHATVEVATGYDLLSGGFYYNLHKGPTSLEKNPEIACGDIGATPAHTAGTAPEPEPYGGG